MEWQDDRTPVQLATHRWAWGGTDRFLSGWGRAQGGQCYAFWAYQDGDGPACEAWVRSRGDMLRVRQVRLSNYRLPAGPGHCHIYVWKAHVPVPPFMV